MIKLSVPNLEKWIHSFVQNLTFQVSPISIKRMNKISFTYYDGYRMNFELLVEVLKDIVKKNTLDVTDMQSVCRFIEKQTKFLDKCVYPESTFLSIYYHNHINKKTVQSIRDIKMSKDAREEKAVKCKGRALKLKREAAIKECDQICNVGSIKRVMLDEKSKDSLVTKSKNISLKELGVRNGITACVRQEAALNERYFQLHINHAEFMKSVHITLYIASKVI